GRLSRLVEQDDRPGRTLSLAVDDLLAPGPQVGVGSPAALQDDVGVLHEPRELANGAHVITPLAVLDDVGIGGQAGDLAEAGHDDPVNLDLEIKLCVWIVARRGSHRMPSQLEFGAAVFSSRSRRIRRSTGRSGR